MRKSLLLLPPALLLTACAHDSRPLLNGRVEAYLTDLGPRVGGRLVDLKVAEGQRVKKGDLLAQVAAEEIDAAVDRDTASYNSAQAKNLELKHGSREEDIAQGRAKVHDAQAQLTLADDTLRRSRNLFSQQVLSQAELDQAQATRDQALANLNVQQKALAELEAGARVEERQSAEAQAQAAAGSLAVTKAQAGFTEIRAPFDGVIVHRLRELGSVLAAGQPVITIARQDQLWVRVYLPQPIQASATLNMPVTVLTQDNRQFQATLDEISSDPEYTPKMVETREERVNLVYQARVHLNQGWDKGLLPGVAVDVRLDGPAGQAQK